MKPQLAYRYTGKDAQAHDITLREYAGAGKYWARIWFRKASPATGESFQVSKTELRKSYRPVSKIRGWKNNHPNS